MEALGLDEVLFARIGPWHCQDFSTQIVDVNAGQLLDVVPGRSGDKPKEWLEAKGRIEAHDHLGRLLGVLGEDSRG